MGARISARDREVQSNPFMDDIRERDGQSVVGETAGWGTSLSNTQKVRAIAANIECEDTLISVPVSE